jgi:Adenylate and Guanylate cyclase catalytic domain
MSLFGYPVAHENDTERAVQAALAIQRALAELNRKNAGTGKPAIAARIGLDTGPVVVDATGEIYGEVPNTAARVQALAEPGAVLVTARVQRQVAGLFVAEERATRALKGVSEPTALFRLVRASGGGRRSAQRHLTSLVGRDQFYIQLTEIEAAFKNLKADLELRPIYHQRIERIEAHIFVAFMAYCLHVTLRQ